MTTFDNRERAFEDMYARDADMQFKLMARRDKLLGYWAAGVLGKSGDDVEQYARTVVLADLEKPGDEDVFDKVFGDLAGRATEAEIRDAMATTLVEARRQLMDIA